MGECGNRIGNAFWKTLGTENGLEQDGRFKQWPYEYQAQLDKIDVYYQEVGTMRFVPRACLVDLDPSTMDVIKASPMAALFKPDNMCVGTGGTGNNWYTLFLSSTQNCNNVMYTVPVWFKKFPDCTSILYKNSS